MSELTLGLLRPCLLFLLLRSGRCLIPCDLQAVVAVVDCGQGSIKHGAELRELLARPR